MDISLPKMILDVCTQEVLAYKLSNSLWVDLVLDMVYI